MNELPCPNCGHPITINIYVCPICCVPIIKTIENQTIEAIGADHSRNAPIISNLEIGESVVVNNKEHPYYQEIALVCDKKHLFVRLELNGYKIWMPNDWVERYHV